MYTNTYLKTNNHITGNYVVQYIDILRLYPCFERSKVHVIHNIRDSGRLINR